MSHYRTNMFSTLLVAGLWITACGSSNGNNGPTNGGNPARFAAFNTGLNAWIQFFEERRPKVFEALESLEVDVLCLSGVFDDNDVEEITTRMKVRLPHAHLEKTSDSSPKETHCSDGNALIATQKCMQDECIPIGLSSGDCVTNQCREQYDTLSAECRYCVSSHPDNPISCLTGGAQTFGMNGRNGLLLLSRYPIQQPSFSPLETTVVKRGVLSATIAQTTVHCTMLTMDLPQLPYPDHLSDYSSWEEEHQAEVEQTIEVTTSDGCTVLMGDLGSGPASSTSTPVVEAHFGNNFQLLLEAGFEEPWSNRQCTYCKENPLIQPPANRQLDHVLIRNCPDFAPLQYTRILDDPISVTDRQGTEHVTSLAANYGLLLEIK